MLRVRLTASGIGLAATLSVLISSGCTPAPTEIVAVDSGVNVMPDMVVPITTAQLRFGNFVAGAAPVDLCIKAQGESSFTGPILRTLAQRTGGVSYLNMGQYVTLTAGSYTVRAVPGTRTDCAVAYGGLPDLGLPTIGAGRSYTLVPFGDQTRIGTVKLNLFEDDLTPQEAKFGCALSTHRRMFPPQTSDSEPAPATKRCSPTLSAETWDAAVA